MNTQTNDDTTMDQGATATTQSDVEEQNTSEHEALPEGSQSELEILVGETKPLKWGKQHQLAIDDTALERSLMALRFGVFADAVNSTILEPNFPFLVSPGAHPDSFESTDPFDFSGATYFLPMTSLLATAIASTFIGGLSDRQGRRPWVILCMGAGVIGSIAKYFARKSFWGFCAANFVNGLFAASLPVAMAYVSDVKSTRAEKDAEIGVMVGMNMIGMTGGGICAILMPKNLFSPLFIGAGLNFAATIVSWIYLIEPSKMLHLLTSDDPQKQELEELEDARAPKALEWGLVWNVLVGALFDNFGSAGLLPIAMSPLAFTEFYVKFLERGADPLMTETAFKWLFVMVALTVIPGAAVSQVMFDKIGVAGSCVAANIFTGVAEIGLLYIALIDPPTDATYAGFITVLYTTFPLTVISQLSTGPMLDMLSPVDRRGFTQGLNISIMSGATAVSPFVLGVLADEIGTTKIMWTCAGISFAAAAVNAPLIFASALKRLPPLQPDFLRVMKGEDSDIVEKALRGEWVPQRFLYQINERRLQAGQRFLVQPYRTYEDDKGHLVVLRQQANEDFEFQLEIISHWLEDLDTHEKRKEVVEKIKVSRSPVETQMELKEALGKWFTDYLEDSGYWVDDSPTLYKQLIMSAFPPLQEGPELTPDNLEPSMVNTARLFKRHLAGKEQFRFNQAFARRFGQGPSNPTRRSFSRNSFSGVPPSLPPPSTMPNQRSVSHG